MFHIKDVLNVLLLPRYETPLPTLPPGLPILSDDEIQKAPLPSVPPSYDDAVRDDEEGGYVDDSQARPPDRRTGSASSAGAESGIDMEDREVDEVMTPLLSQADRDGGKPVTIEMDGMPDPTFHPKLDKSVETTV